MHIIIKEVSVIIIAYLIGGVLFSDIIIKNIKGKNIKEMGSGNPGAKNVFIQRGKFWGIFVGLLDGAKGLIAVIIPCLLKLPEIFIVLSGFFAILGHCFPIYYKFKGGKGVSTALGVFIFLTPIELLIAIPFAFLSFFTTRLIWLSPTLLIAIPVILSPFFGRSFIVIISIMLIGIFIMVMTFKNSFMQAIISKDGFFYTLNKLSQKDKRKKI